jgi:hypothetical protein
MRRNNGGRRGAALVVAFVVMIVLSILVAAVYILFAGNVASQEFTDDGIAARFTAEAGARLAVHELALRTELPVDTDPFYMPDDSSGWIRMMGIQGRALVVIDPRNNVQNPWAIRGVEIRSRGSFQSRAVDVMMHYAPDTPSRYALLVDDAIPAGFFTDGRTVEGPVRCNGIITFGSLSSDSTDDPYVEEISTTSEGGFYFSDTGMSDVPHPDGSAIWVRPYRKHLAGSPAWDASVNPIDFTRISSHFTGLVDEASEMGTVVSGVKRIILDGNSVLMRSAENGPITVLELNHDQNLLYIMNGSMPVYIKSGQSINMPLTIVSSGSVYIYGHIRGPAAGDNGPLAIVSLRDFIIPTDPSYIGATDWSSPWDIQTESNLGIQAYLAAPSGELRSESTMYPPAVLALTITGGLMEKRMGHLGNNINGYELMINYDQGLRGVMPPYFPLLEDWIMTSWIDDPNYEDIKADQY